LFCFFRGWVVVCVLVVCFGEGGGRGGAGVVAEVVE